MSLLDSVLGTLAGAQPGAQTSAPGATQGNAGSVLLGTVIAMLANGQQAQGAGVGGLGDLIGRFTQGGLGDLVHSWIGTGPNAPVTGDQLGQVLGSDALGKIAAQLGVDPAEAAGQIAKILPEVVDRLTPHGQAPSGGLGEVGDILAQLTAKR